MICTPLWDPSKPSFYGTSFSSVTPIMMMLLMSGAS
jgi:hypothetical protein